MRAAQYAGISIERSSMTAYLLMLLKPWHLLELVGSSAALQPPNSFEPSMHHRIGLPWLMWSPMILLTQRRSYALRAAQAAEAAQAAQSAADAAWRAAERQAAAFRIAHQDATSRRDWDLQRPDALRLDTPAR